MISKAIRSLRSVSRFMAQPRSGAYDMRSLAETAERAQLENKWSEPLARLAKRVSELVRSEAE